MSWPRSDNNIQSDKICQTIEVLAGIVWSGGGGGGGGVIADLWTGGRWKPV